MNNGPVLVLSALSIMWLLLEFQRRRWPRVVVGSVVVAMQLLFGMIVLDAVYDRGWMAESQRLFMQDAASELKLGNRDRVLRAMMRMNDARSSPDFANKLARVLDDLKREDEAKSEN